MRYALLNPQGGIDRLDSSVDPTVQTRPGWRWVPAPIAAPPAFDSATETLEGQVRTLQDGQILESYTVRAKTPAELDAERERTLDRIDQAILRVLLSQENRLRALEGQPALAPARFRAVIKALL